MEILAYIAIVLIVVLCGIWSAKYTYRRYQFEMFSGLSIGLALTTVIAWALVFAFYQPGTAEEQWVEIFAGLFVIGVGLILPVYLLVHDIRKTNLFWGLIAFLYQLLFVASVVLLLLLVFARLSED